MNKESNAFLVIFSGGMLLLLPQCGHYNRQFIRRKVTYIKKCADNFTTTKYEETTPHKDLNLQKNPPPITIWVHGTRFIRKPAYYHSFQSTPGLKLAEEIHPDFHLNRVAQVLSRCNPDKHPLETFYIFGWSGKLDSAEREDVAQTLYQDLCCVVQEYQRTYATDPVIRIIAHSHGGNVALNLAKIKEKEDIQLVINELVLLATPVQNRTKDFVKDPMFKKIYSLYSSLDLVQLIAPQIVKCHSVKKNGKTRRHYSIPPTSGRLFPKHVNLEQVKIKMNRWALFHAEFTKPHFLVMLPNILQTIQSWHEPRKENQEEEPCHPRDKFLCIYTKYVKQRKKIAQEIHA